MTSRSAPAAPLPEAVRVAWFAGREVDRALLAHLSSAMLEARTPGGGMSVAEHLGHLLGATAGWGWGLEGDGPCRAIAEPRYDAERDDFRPVRDLAEATELLDSVADAALAAADAAPDGSPDVPHRDAAALLIHQLVHHAHHRGQILLALKTAGHPLPDDDAMWAPWKHAG